MKSLKDKSVSRYTRTRNKRADGIESNHCNMCPCLSRELSAEIFCCSLIFVWDRKLLDGEDGEEEDVGYFPARGRL